MGDLGLPGSVVEMADAAPQKNLWEVRKAGLNIMMSMKGDGKPVSFIEDCAVPLEHLADYTDAPHRGVRPPRHARHLVRACLGRHAARAADPRHAARRRGEDARDRRGSRRRWCASTRAPISGEHGDGLCRGEWIAWQFGPRAQRGVPRDQGRCSIRPACSIPARSSIRRGWTTRALFRFPPPARRSRTRSRSSPRSTGRRGTCRTIRVTEQRRPRPAAAAIRPAASPRRSRCATTTATAASSTPAPCARAIASRATSSM